MCKFFKKVFYFSVSIISLFFTFVPEKIFENNIFNLNISAEKCIIMNRVLTFIVVILIVCIVYTLYIKFRRKITIKGKDYIIEVKYGNINKQKKCKRVINFDECYTQELGNLPHQIKKTSVCGQYLLKHPNLDVKELIKENNIQKSEKNSMYNNTICYKSGTIVPNGDDLLMAFAELDEDGRGVFRTYQEYIDCLFYLWQEIDKYYAQNDVCIPILGSGLTRIGDTSITQQEALEKIIISYKLSNYKIKKPYKLRIICKKNDDFSLNKIEEI